MRRFYRTSWGAQVCDDGVRFRLWAPAAKSVSAVIFGQSERIVTMEAAGDGWYESVDRGSQCGTRYLYEIDGKDRVPDPAARFAPHGPRSPCEVIDPKAFEWPERPTVLPAFRELVFYELHVGTFTPSGTYAEAATHLDYLADLGISALELMPLAERPGAHNWGYDGVLFYAPAHRYGSPDDLKKFIVAAHERDIVVFLDVVYNHFGPQDNYLSRYAPQFFTDAHHTPWGIAIDYGQDAVRSYVIENASYWLCEYGFDGLRLDAVQTIFDAGDVHILEMLAAKARADASRNVYLVVENDDNNAGLLFDGYDAQWNDDVHHCLHAALTGENDGYYQDYEGDPVRLLGRALTQGFAFQGEVSPFRDGRRRGTPSAALPLCSFVNFLQNHDQIGNRAFGDRIGALASPEAVRAALAILLLAPSPPLLFMGQEWAAGSPFLFFCDFEPNLARLVTEGRRKEFARFARFADPKQREKIPDPAAPSTFESSRLAWNEMREEGHAQWLELHRTLLRLRRKEISSRTEGLTGCDAAFEQRGSRGLCAQWTLTGRSVLRLETNLGSASQSGFSERPEGRMLFATHESFEGGVAPPWTVRWSLSST
jgi:maltooligosyltrehalose trehalohydrolase